jgi:hypothetical protein
MSNEPLKYQCTILVGGATFYCIESYDSVFDRIRDTAYKVGEGDIAIAPPLELTVGVGFSDHPGEPRLVRAAISPQAIAAVYEIPADIANEAP